MYAPIATTATLSLLQQHWLLLLLLSLCRPIAATCVAVAAANNLLDGDLPPRLLSQWNIDLLDLSNNYFAGIQLQDCELCKRNCSRSSAC
jgi:hypothetical protein